MRLFSRTLSIASVLLLVGCNPPTAPVPPTAPTLGWTSNGNVGTPNCNANQKTGCLTTYTLIDTTTNTVISTSISADALSYTLSNLPNTGTHVYQLTINGVDINGKIVSSAPATTSVTIP